MLEFIRILKLLLLTGIIYFLCQLIQFPSILVQFCLKVFFIILSLPAGLLLMQFFSVQEKERLLYSMRNRTLAGWK